MPRLFPDPLQQNMRNTRAIHDFARRFYSGAAQKAGGVPGRPPEVIALEEGQPLAKALAGQLQRLIREEQVPPEHIAILTGRKPKTLGLDAPNVLGAFALTDAEHPQPGRVTLDTIHRFKGLDAPVVILTGLEGINAANANTLIYVGITRARQHLVVLEKPEVLSKWGLAGVAESGGTHSVHVVG